MENPTPQEENPSRPPNGGPVKIGPLGSSSRPWQWLLLLGLFALVFWLYVPKTEIQVFYPWFLEQVENDNVKSISIRGLEIRGELRKARRYLYPPLVDATVRKFYTKAQSDASIEQTVRTLTERNQKKETNPVLIETRPPK
ncbi:MAG: hypothetical protein ACHRXM_09280 [Isosphaerales bacterium]